MMRDAKLYYGQPDMYASAGTGRATGDRYRNFSGCSGDGCNNATAPAQEMTEQIEIFRPQQNRTAPSRTLLTRTHITNPFWQPETGRLSSLTDIGYMSERISTSVDLLPAYAGLTTDTDWNFSNDLFQINQNFAFGVTDEFAIIGNLRYLNSKSDISTAQDGSWGSSSDGKIDTFGIGARWLFVDNLDWVGYLQAGYQPVVNIANMFSGRLQVGYKNDDTVIYVFGQVQYYDWTVKDIGFGIENQNNEMINFEVATNLTGSTQFEVGAGAFMAFNNEWALDINVALADRDWHRQVYGMAAINYQPWDNAALSVYGRLTLWDDMNSLNDLTLLYQDPFFPRDIIGTASITESSSYAVGLQLTLLF